MHAPDSLKRVSYLIGLKELKYFSSMKINCVRLEKQGACNGTNSAVTASKSLKMSIFTTHKRILTLQPSLPALMFGCFARGFPISNHLKKKIGKHLDIQAS